MICYFTMKDSQNFIYIIKFIPGNSYIIKSSPNPAKKLRSISSYLTAQIFTYSFLKYNMVYNRILVYPAFQLLTLPILIYMDEFWHTNPFSQIFHI